MRSAVTLTRLEPAVRQALERAAAADGRTVSGLIAKIITDWLKAQQPAKEKDRWHSSSSSS